MRSKAAFGLLLIDLGIFVATCTFLPGRGSFGYSGPLSYFVNSRHSWDIAWGVLVAALVMSWGVFKLMDACGAFGRPSSTSGTRTADSETRHDD